METILPEMMQNYILLDRVNKELMTGSLHVPDEVLNTRARVIAVGPGKYLPSGEFIKMRVSPGDVVSLDRTRMREICMLYWGGTEYLVGKDDMVICKLDILHEPEAPRIVAPTSSDIAAPDLQ